VVVTGLQHRVELLEKDKASLDEALQVEKGHSFELKADKETLQKQVELQMLQLPAPKVGFCLGVGRGYFHAARRKALENENRADIPASVTTAPDDR